MIQQTIFYFQQKVSSHYYGRSCHTARSTFVTCPRSVGSDSRTDVNEGSNDFLCLFPVPLKKVSTSSFFPVLLIAFFHRSPCWRRHNFRTSGDVLCKHRRRVPSPLESNRRKNRWLCLQSRCWQIRILPDPSCLGPWETLATDWNWHIGWQSWCTLDTSTSPNFGGRMAVKCSWPSSARPKIPLRSRTRKGFFPEPVWQCSLFCSTERVKPSWQRGSVQNPSPRRWVWNLM